MKKYKTEHYNSFFIQMHAVQSPFIFFKNRISSCDYALRWGYDHSHFLSAVLLISIEKATLLKYRGDSTIFLLFHL